MTKKYTDSFHKALRFGQIGEQLMLDYFNDRENILRIEDVRDMPIYQQKDIDFILFYVDNVGKIVKENVDIKTDSNLNSGNIFYETMSNENTGHLGSFIRTEADKFYYIFYNQNNNTGRYAEKFLVLDIPDLNKWVAYHEEELKYQHLLKDKDMPSEHYKAGYLVPIEKILKEPFCKMYNYPHILLENYLKAN